MAALSPAVLSSKPITPPPSWAEDCSRLLRALKHSGSHSVGSSVPLSSDEVTIYRTVLQNWKAETPTLLNLSDRTIPLDAISSAGISDCECLKDIDIRSLLSATHSFHRLTRDAFRGSSIRLVNANRQIRTVQNNDPSNWIGRGKSVTKAVNDAFATGLFSLSEIAFDKEHRRALVSYSFGCGSLCGSGGTWLFVNVDGVWKRTDHGCGGWVS